MEAKKEEVFKLANNLNIPKIMLGTYPLKGYEMVKAVTAAMKNGYRGIDAASAYGNERWLKVARMTLPNLKKKMFVTTKFNEFEENVNVRNELEGSLKRIGVESIDLYLMHWPHPKNYIDAWKQMEELYQEGKIKAIGVCNFQERHLEKLLDKATIKPMVNQIEIHPLLTQKKLIQFCKEQNIMLEAYCPFGQMNPMLYEKDILKEISVAHHKTIAQVILRWNIEQEIIPIPRSSSVERIKQNSDIFDFSLTEEEIHQIDTLNKGYKVYQEEKYCPGY